MDDGRGLRISPWHRHGHERLSVSLPGGERIAWYDRRSGRLTVLVEAYRDQALATLTPYLTGRPHPSAQTPPDPLAAPLPQDDLALHRPGETPRRTAGAPRPGRRALLRRLAGGRPDAARGHADPRGEHVVGAELERLTGGGWYVLHAVPLPPETAIDHLLVGPGGVFCLHTERHPRATARVGEDLVRVGRHAHPYVRQARREAVHASAALTRHCGFPVPVRPVLVLVGVRRLTVVPTLHDVCVLRDRQLGALGATGGVLSPATAARVHAVARDRATWPTT
ncbi:nuclease-related domain-containing protein [Streptomyces sp. TRM70308]|uniref:nuclease-related domain-containing protein n=1 Tax=Streptomyces sp. TRM70308 TaxID=3131932 RepID=UPI003CFF8A15